MGLGHATKHPRLAPLLIQLVGSRTWQNINGYKIKKKKAIVKNVLKKKKKSETEKYTT